MLLRSFDLFPVNDVGLLGIDVWSILSYLKYLQALLWVNLPVLLKKLHT